VLSSLRVFAGLSAAALAALAAATPIAVAQAPPTDGAMIVGMEAMHQYQRCRRWPPS
jgi:hypothetical protein